MRTIRTLFFAGMVAVVFGCTSKGWQGSSVPLPRSTPYDSNQLARNAYLEGFRTGYRAQQSPGQHGMNLLSGPYVHAQQQGFQAGAAQARAEFQGEQPPASTPMR